MTNVARITGCLVGLGALSALALAALTNSRPPVVPQPAATEPGRIINLAIRSQAGVGAQTLIVGVTIGGAGTSGTKPILFRGVGPTLAAFGLTNFVADPRLAVFSDITFQSNDDWGGTPALSNVFSQVGAFPYASADSKDAALFLPTVAKGSYTMQIGSNQSATGIALAEVYDATAPGTFTSTTPRLTNISARTQVGTGGDILIAGFVIGGGAGKTVLIRAAGPALSAFDVTGYLTDPKLEIYASDNSLVATNDNWGGTATLSAAFTAVGAFAFDPNSKDAAVLVTLPPGGYTAQVSGVGGLTGVALVEVYEMP